MRRAAFLTTLAGGALSLRCLARAELPEEKAVYDLLDAAVDAQFTYDFERLVRLLHPDSTELFRKVQAARFDQLLKTYPLEEILAVTGLPAHPKDVAQSDADFFVSVCKHARELQEDFVGDPKVLPLALHGTIFEGAAMAYIVFSYAGSVHTQRTDFDYAAPMTFTCRKVETQWLIYSALLAPRVADLWWRQLSRQKAAAQSSKQVG